MPTDEQRKTDSLRVPPIGRLALALFLGGIALVGAGMLLFSDSNLLGGLGPLGVLVSGIGLVMLVVLLIAGIVRHQLREDPPRD